LTLRRFPRSGSFIAVRDVPDDGRFRIEQTADRATHWTIWGDADALAVVAGQIKACGREAVELWVLLENDGTETEEGLRRIAYGSELADLALRQAERASTACTAD
jgi:hypothetical protein